MSRNFQIFKFIEKSEEFLKYKGSERKWSLEFLEGSSNFIKLTKKRRGVGYESLQIS